MKYIVKYDPETSRSSTQDYTYVYDVSDENLYWAQVKEAVKEEENPAVAMNLYKGYDVDVNGKLMNLYLIKEGGYIENPWNLSQAGDCWIKSEAKVIGQARVVGDAIVYSGLVAGFSKICGEAEVSGSDTIIDGIDTIIAGTVESSKIYDYVTVMDGGKVINRSIVGKGVSDSSRISRTTIGGTVDKSLVLKGSVVLGEVKKKCTIGLSTVMEGAEVEGKVLVYNAVVCGHVKAL